MKSTKRFFLLLLTVLFFCVCSFNVVYAESENNFSEKIQKNEYQIKINLQFLDYCQEITPELFGINELEILEINQIKGYNEQTGINELKGYFVVVEIPVNNIENTIHEIENLDFVEEVKSHFVPENFELNFDINKIDDENRIVSVFGDVNSDYKITAGDARLVLRIAANLEKLNISDISVADVDGDKKITSIDARCILRASANIDELNVKMEIKANTEYLIGPLGTGYYIGNWDIISVSENVNVYHDYSLDISAPGNMGYDYYLFSVPETGEYEIVLRNKTQNRNINVVFKIY